MMLSLLVALLASQQAPLGVGKAADPWNYSTTQYPQHIFFSTDGGVGSDAIDCLNISKAGRWECLALRTDIPAPTTAPVPPAILLPPASAPPSATYPVGTTYYNTTCGRLLSYDGTAWQGCPTNTAGTGVQQSSTPPSLPSGAAASNRGAMYFDSTQGCHRATLDGLTWGPCLNTEVCTSVPVAAVSLPILGATTTQTATLTGAINGKPCSVGAPGGLLNIGVTYACSITAPGVASFRFQGALGLNIAGGNYTVCTEVLW